MHSVNTVVTAIGIAYGCLLVLTMFVRSPVTEAMRIDALFSNQYSENTRPINLVAGLLFAGYGLYALLAG